MLCFDATLLYRNFHFPMRIVEVGPRLQCEKVLRLLFLRIPLELWAYLILLHYLNPWPDLGGCPCPALSYQHGLPSMYCSHFLARLRKLFELLLYPNISWYVSWLWQYRLWSFQVRDKNLERFLSKNQL